MLRLEGVAIVGLGVYLVVRDFGSDIHSHVLLAILAVMTIAAGAFLLVSSRLLPIGTRWPRTPTVLIQFFIFIVSYYLLNAHRLLLALPLFAIALTTAATVLRLGSQDGEE